MFLFGDDKRLTCKIKQGILGGAKQRWLKVTLSPSLSGDSVNKRPGKLSPRLLTTGDGDQVGYVILTVWNSCELFADRYKQLLFLVMESN